MYIIIQHLCIGIENYPITKRVHNSMHKQNSWTSTETTNDIKIINNIILPQYDDILGQSYGYSILPGNHYHNIHHNFLKTRKKNKSCILCSTIRYYASYKLYSIRKCKILHFPESSLYI